MASAQSQLQVAAPQSIISRPTPPPSALPTQPAPDRWSRTDLNSYGRGLFFPPLERTPSIIWIDGLAVDQRVFELEKYESKRALEVLPRIVSAPPSAHPVPALGLVERRRARLLRAAGAEHAIQGAMSSTTSFSPPSPHSANTLISSAALAHAARSASQAPATPRAPLAPAPAPAPAPVPHRLHASWSTSGGAPVLTSLGLLYGHRSHLCCQYQVGTIECTPLTIVLCACASTFPHLLVCCPGANHVVRVPMDTTYEREFDIFPFSNAGLRLYRARVRYVNSRWRHNNDEPEYVVRDLNFVSADALDQFSTAALRILHSYDSKQRAPGMHAHDGPTERLSFFAHTLRFNYGRALRGVRAPSPE